MDTLPEPAVAEGGALELYLTPGSLLIYQRTDINQTRFIGIQCGEFSSVGAVTVIQLKVIRTRLDLHGQVQKIVCNSQAIPGIPDQITEVVVNHRCLINTIELAGIIVFVLDEKRAIDRLYKKNGRLMESFTARFDIAALDSATLVKYGCQYAYTQEYSIDELGRLALHTRIEDMQTIDHVVTVVDVKEIVDEAIAHANKKTLKHFFDVLFAKRYDDEDMIILTEKDFV